MNDRCLLVNYMGSDLDKMRQMILDSKYHLESKNMANFLTKLDEARMLLSLEMNVLTDITNTTGV